MGKYKLIVRSRLLMGRPVTDDDRKVLDCYHETPVFCADSNRENIEIIDEAYEQFCVGKQAFCHADSVQLVCIE